MARNSKSQTRRTGQAPQRRQSPSGVAGRKKRIVINCADSSNMASSFTDVLTLTRLASGGLEITLETRCFDGPKTTTTTRYVADVEGPEWLLDFITQPPSKVAERVDLPSTGVFIRHVAELDPALAEATERLAGARLNWEDQTAVCDCFVEAVYASNDALADRAGTRLVRGVFDTGWDCFVSVCDGTLLPPDMLPTTPDECVSGVSGVEALEGRVSPRRFEELQADGTGEPSLTPEELSLWRRLAAEDILSENPDCDVYPLWGVWRVTHSDGRVAFLGNLGGGYSFSEPWAEYVCAAETEEAALATLRKHGFLTVDDFRARWQKE